MEFGIEQAKLFRSVDAVSDVVPAKTAIPVLTHLLIEAVPGEASSGEGESGHLSISATDLDLSITTVVPCSVRESGRCTVPARKFLEIVRELPGGVLGVEGKDNRLTIRRCGPEIGAAGGKRAGASVRPGEGIYALMGLPAGDYPELPAEVEGTELPLGGEQGLQGSDLKDMVGKTAFAVSKDETRPVLNGVLCQVKGDGITMVATDGHRLVRHRKAVDLARQLNGKDQAEAIIPPRVLQSLVKLLSGEGRLSRCVIGENHILFDLGDTRLVSRLIEGPYVDYEQVIPKDNAQEVTVSNSSIAPSVRRVSILSSAQTHQIRLGLRRNEIELSAVNQDFGGEARESIQADYSGADMDVGYNSVYLLDILKRIDSEDVILNLNTPVTAGIVRPATQPEGEDYLCLLMPLRLGE